MLNVEKSINVVREFAASDRCKSRNWLANQAGISEISLRNIASPNWNPLVSTLRKLEAVVESAQRNQP